MNLEEEVDQKFQELYQSLMVSEDMYKAEPDWFDLGFHKNQFCLFCKKPAVLYFDVMRDVVGTSQICYECGSDDQTFICYVRTFYTPRRITFFLYNMYLTYYLDIKKWEVSYNNICFNIPNKMYDIEKPEELYDYFIDKYEALIPFS